MTQSRKIIHVDMDAFFASIEQRDFPEYRDKPLIVGGLPGKRGVVAACSYAARRFGIHSAMPSTTAQRLCPQAIFVRPRFEVYQTVSAQIHRIFRQYTDKVEALSLDEAYLDVSASKLHNGSATLIAKDIRTAIRAKMQLSASAGVSYNKFLAKTASEVNKPDGMYVITPEHAADFIAALPVEKFFGIGKVTAKKLKMMNIHTGADLRQCKRETLMHLFGKAGEHYYQIARGVDTREVVSARQRKSMGCERTFTYDLADRTQMLVQLDGLIRQILILLEKKKVHARTFILKVKYTDFQQVTRSKTLTDAYWRYPDLLAALPMLLDKTAIGYKKVRLLGVSVGNLIKAEEAHRVRQITLFN